MGKTKRILHDGDSDSSVNSEEGFSFDDLSGRKRQRRKEGDEFDVKVDFKVQPTEASNLHRLSGTFGAKMLEKMGWKFGTGLGATGEGMVTPIESKMRPQKMGIAFKGFKERTDQSKREARRRGELISEDEVDDIQAKNLSDKLKHKQRKKRSDVWQKPRTIKEKIEHKTYEQLLAEAGQEDPVFKIIDATGAIPREVSSITDVLSCRWSPSSDSTRIPEVRYNIQLIADACKRDVDNLIREGKILDRQKKICVSEGTILRKNLATKAELLERLKNVKLVVDDINKHSKKVSGVDEASLEPLTPLFHSLVEKFPDEFEPYHLDEVIVASIAPSVRRLVAIWNPLANPLALIPTFRTWRVLKVTSEDNKNLDRSSNFNNLSSESTRLMTPFEALLWKVWLPRVRSCINNDWIAEEPQSLVGLYETWASFLPPFIRDNFFDQLIMPKVKKAVHDWIPKHNIPLQAIIFPWLPQLGLRMDDILSEALRKIKGLLKVWTLDDDVPTELSAWKNLLDAPEWDSMILKYVIPKLAATLRDDFRINPRDQNMEPFKRVLLWRGLIRPSIFSQVLEIEFFPKWLDILYIWLIQPTASLEEVAQWYSYWKETFPEDMQQQQGIAQGFTRALQLMNTAIELGPRAASQLVKPDYRAGQEVATTSRERTSKNHCTALSSSALALEVTFKSIVEEFASSRNLLFIPTGRSHDVSRMPLFRISRTVDGKSGLLVYLLDDAVWADIDGKGYVAISFDEMASRAN